MNQINSRSKMFADGSIYTANTVTAEKAAAGKVKIDWDNTILDGHEPNTLAGLVLYNELTNQVLSHASNVIYQAGTVTVDMSEIWNGASIQCWIYFTSDNGMRYSNSQYIKSIEL